MSEIGEANGEGYTKINSRTEYHPNGRRESDSDMRLSAGGSRVSFVMEASSNWTLAGGELKHRRAKNKIVSATVAGRDLSSMTNADLSKEFGASSIQSEGVSRVSKLTPDRLVLVQELPLGDVVVECQRPEAARAAALATAEEARALREAN